METHKSKRLMQRLRSPYLLLFIVVYLLCGITRIATSFDSRWTVPVVLQLFKSGNIRLDDYKAMMREAPGYGVVCVISSGVTPETDPERCVGHWYPAYPLGGPLLAAPIVLLYAGIFEIVGLDPLRYRAHIEMESASVLIAVAAVLIFAIAKRQTTTQNALTVAFIFALATPAFSTGTRALWQHTFSVFLLTISIYLLMRASTRPALYGWAGLPVALLCTVRPSNAFFVVLLTVYVARRNRGALFRFGLFAFAVALLFLTLNLSVYHDLLPPYYKARAGMDAPGYWPAVVRSACGLLFSPSRGLIVFTPIFLFSVYNMIRGDWRVPIASWLAAGTGCYFVLLCLFLGPASYPGNWWGGASYGPRLLTDLSPLLCLFLIPTLEKWPGLSPWTRKLFLCLALVSGVIHYRAAWAEAVWRWNVTPQNVDVSSERVWDWKDPQFLRWRSI